MWIWLKTKHRLQQVSQPKLCFILFWTMNCIFSKYLIDAVTQNFPVRSSEEIKRSLITLLWVSFRIAEPIFCCFLHPKSFAAMQWQYFASNQFTSTCFGENNHKEYRVRGNNNHHSGPLHFPSSTLWRVRWVHTDWRFEAKTFESSRCYHLGEAFFC